ncbi:hypothetical protein [Amphibacillus sediminis]|uniref:hypothetical protein n=1 Tax=Amphibacillus sediminis TaxID=360185 RepID=UPI000836F317|nr:hypothetical protein [Amphibacillus sediminis]
MEKKFLKILPVLLGVIALFLIQPTQTLANSVELRPILEVNSLLTNNHTNQLEDATTITELTTIKENEDGTITESYEVDVAIPQFHFRPMDSVGGSKTEGYVKASLDITYFLRDKKSEIKITKFSGKWEPQQSYMKVSNRVASVNDGRGLFSKTIRKRPTSNSFSYNTGWDYVTYVPHSTDLYTGPRGYTEATLKPEGMGGSYNLFLTVNVSR